MVVGTELLKLIIDDQDHLKLRKLSDKVVLIVDFNLLPIGKVELIQFYLVTYYGNACLNLLNRGTTPKAAGPMHYFERDPAG